MIIDILIYIGAFIVTAWIFEVIRNNKNKL